MLKLPKTIVLRLLGIGLVAPLLLHLLAFPLAPLLLFTIAVSYPVTVVATLLLLFPLHLTFKNRRATRNVQLLVVSFLGLSLGCAIYLTLFAPFPAERFSPLLAASYALFGLGASTLSWALYTWGPLRIELTHSEA